MKKEKSAKSEAYELLNCYVKGVKLLNKSIGDRYKDDSIYSISNPSNRIQVANLIRWCELLEMPYTKEVWDGNEHCDTNYDIIQFNYKGCHFIELVEREE